MTEELYLVAYKDIEQKEIDESLWLKAMSHAGGDKLRAKWVYIELRVDQMLRDPSLRHSASRKVSKPIHQSGAYMNCPERSFPFYFRPSLLLRQ